MFVRFMSDLHLEFGVPLEVPVSENEANTVLVLAGDIGVLASPLSYIPFIVEMSERFQDVIWIMGNHEYYGGNLPTGLAKAKKLVDAEGVTNVHVVDNEVVKIGDASFVCSTLWSDFDNADPIVMWEAKLRMSDYFKIRTGPKNEPWQRKIDPQDIFVLHCKAKDFILKAIPEEMDRGQKVVLVTHHGISRQSVDPQYCGNKLNGAYVTEFFYHLTQWEKRPVAAIHGHVHTSFDYDMDGIRVLCNPRGYAGLEENPGFDPVKEIEI